MDRQRLSNEQIVVVMMMAFPIHNGEGVLGIRFAFSWRTGVRRR